MTNEARLCEQHAQLYINALGINDNPNNNFNDNQIKNIAVGSNFNKVILLKYIHGNINEIITTFLTNDFKKIYINENNIDITNIYKRIAKRLIKTI